MYCILNTQSHSNTMINTHFIVRVQDGINFKNSKHPMWGVKAGLKGVVSNMKPGDILWFVTNKQNNCLLVGMAEFVSMHDRRDEPLFSIHTYTNEEMGWSGNTDWCIQIHYNNLYFTEYHNIQIPLKGQNTIRYYKNCIDKIDKDLYAYYHGFKNFAIPIFT
jgi:hypothetical protein